MTAVPESQWSAVADQPQRRKGSGNPAGVPKGTLTREQYAAMLGVFRDNPASIEAAAKAAGVGWKTAHKAWHRGWVKGGHGVPAMPWARPISQVVAEEREEARLAAAKAAAASGQVQVESEVEVVRREAQARKVEWAQAAGGARRTAMMVLRVNQQALAAVLGRSQEWLADLTNGTMKAADALRITRQIGLSTKLSAETLRLAQEVEAITVGSPTEILGLVPVTGEAYSSEEAEEIIERAHNVVVHVRELRRAKGSRPVESVGEPMRKGTGSDPQLPPG